MRGCREVTKLKGFQLRESTLFSDEIGADVVFAVDDPLKNGNRDFYLGTRFYLDGEFYDCIGMSRVDELGKKIYYGRKHKDEFYSRERGYA